MNTRPVVRSAAPGSVPRTSPRRGISLFLVLGVLLIVSLLAFSAHHVAEQSLRRARRMADSHVATLLTRSAVACAIGRLQEGLADPRSDLNAQLTSPDLATGTLLVIDTSPVRTLAEAARAAQVAVTVSVARVAPLEATALGPTSGGADPAERRLDLMIDAEASCEGATRRFRETREVRVVHLMPGILGKFTLFVRRAATDASGYNRLANNINGWIDDRVPPNERLLPLVLKNGGELDEGTLEQPDPDSYRTRGYVYLGGGPVTLNLAGGDDEGYGENFHFFRLGTPSTIPGYYDLGPPDFFTRPPDFSRRHAQTLNVGGSFAPAFAYALKNVVAGYYTIDQDGRDMNPDQRMTVDFPGPARPCDLRMRSSLLHLYGTRSNPSPTLVLGDVRRRYAEYSAVVVDATGNDVRDGILVYLPQTAGGFAKLPPVPASIQASARGDLPVGAEIRFDPQQLSYPAMFGDESTYKSKMSRLVEEPYLRSHDFMYFREPGQFMPPASRFGGGAAKAQVQSTFRLDFHPSLRRASPYFAEGDLGGLGSAVLRAKAVYRVPDIPTLLQRFGTGPHRELELDGTVIVTGHDGETAQLPADLVVERGGIIMLEHGNLRLSGVRPGHDPDQLVTFAALAGNLELDLSRGHALRAILVALEGQVVNLTPSRPLDLEGTLVVGQLPPDNFPVGGRLAYDSLSDPSGPAWPQYYRAFVADLAGTVERL